MNPRVRPREKYQLSLDGRQVASIVAGALVVLGVVFVLGLNVGKQLAVRHVEAARPGDLEALDRAPAAAPPARPEPLTFHDRLTKDRPAPPPPPDSPPPASSPPTPAAPPAPAPPAAAAAEPPQAAPGPADAPEAAPPAARPAAPLKPWTVQLAASADRAEAERLAGRFAALNPRVEEADVPGKGRFFRVRVGSFDTKDAAQRYLRDVARETGAKGIVTSTR